MVLGRGDTTSATTTRGCISKPTETAPGIRISLKDLIWAILALSTILAEKTVVQLACDHIVATQALNGRVSLVPKITAACWSTPITAFVWKKASCRRGEMGQAMNFIADNLGLHSEREKNAPHDHYTSIPVGPG
jgi:hypothetical protein